MGLLDKMAERARQNAPDYRAVLSASLGPHDEVLGFIMAHPAAFERANTSVLGFLANPQRAITNGLLSLKDKGKYVGGAKDSLAYQIPRDTGSSILAISRQGLSLWDFVTDQQQPRKQLFLPREKIASVRSVQKEGRGQVQVRITFVDESYFDYKVTEHEAFASFWPAINNFVPA